MDMLDGEASSSGRDIGNLHARQAKLWEIQEKFGEHFMISAKQIEHRENISYSGKDTSSVSINKAKQEAASTQGASGVAECPGPGLQEWTCNRLRTSNCPSVQ